MAVTKVGKSKSSSDALDYVLKDELDAKTKLAKNPSVIGGNCFGSPDEIKEQFRAFERLRPKVSNNVVHLSVSFAPDEKVTDERAAQFAGELLDELGFSDAPYLIVRHHDKEQRDAYLKDDEKKEAETNYEHIHIVAGRINVAGEAVKDFQIAKRAIAATKAIETKLGFVETPYIEKEIKNKSRNEREFEARTGEQSDKSRLIEKVLTVQVRMSVETGAETNDKLELKPNRNAHKINDENDEKRREENDLQTVGTINRTDCKTNGKNINRSIDDDGSQINDESINGNQAVTPQKCAAMFADAGVKLLFRTDARNEKLCGVTYFDTETGFVMKGSAGGKSLAINGLAKSGLEIYGQKAIGEGEEISAGTSRHLDEFRRRERAELAAALAIAAATTSVATGDGRNIVGEAIGHPNERAKAGAIGERIGESGENLVGNESRIVGDERNVVRAIVGTNGEFGTGGVGVGAKTRTGERNGANDGIGGYRNQRCFDERNERNDGEDSERKTGGDERDEPVRISAIAANIIAVAATDETIKRADSTATKTANSSKTVIATTAIDSSVARDGDSGESDSATVVAINATAADSAVCLDDSARRGIRRLGDTTAQADSSSDVGVIADDSSHLGHIGFVDGGDDERGIRAGEPGVFERVGTALDVQAIGGLVGGLDAEQHDLFDDASGVVGFDGGEMVRMVGNPPEVGFDAATTYLGVVRDGDDLRYGDVLRFGGVGEIVADGLLRSSVLDNIIEPAGGVDLSVERSSGSSASEAERMIYEDFARATIDFVESRNVAVETLSDEIPVDETSEKPTIIDIVDGQSDFSNDFDI